MRQSVRPRELDGFEYQRMYDTGQMPERWFDYEADRATAEYLNGEIDLAGLEYRLDPEAFVLESEPTSWGPSEDWCGSHPPANSSPATATSLTSRHRAPPIGDGLPAGRAIAAGRGARAISREIVEELRDGLRP